jgi:hypothetical protein
MSFDVVRFPSGFASAVRGMFSSVGSSFDGMGWGGGVGGGVKPNLSTARKLGIFRFSNTLFIEQHNLRVKN